MRCGVDGSCTVKETGKCGGSFVVGCPRSVATVFTVPIRDQAADRQRRKILRGDRRWNPVERVL